MGGLIVVGSVCLFGLFVGVVGYYWQKRINREFYLHREKDNRLSSQMGESDGQSSLQEKPPTVADIFKKWPGFSVFALFSGIFAIIGAFLSPRYYTVVMLSGYAALFGQFYLARNNGKVGKILAKTGIACGIIAIIMLVIQVAMEFL